MISALDELGTVIYEENPRDPYTLESIKESFARVDADLASRGLHWERIVVTGRATHWCGHAPPLHPRDPILVHMALGLKEGQEPSKEQILILGHYLRQCANALDDFQRDGTLPSEEIRKYLDHLASQKLGRRG